MRPSRRAALALTLLLAGACGGGGTPAASAPVPAPAVTTPAAPGTALTGTVGEHDAFTIALVDGAGAPVTTLAPGSYRLTVKDLSQIHDFHLSGPGVDRATGVADTTVTVWSLTLTAGTYTFVCDPHRSSMKGSFVVT